MWNDFVYNGSGHGEIGRQLDSMNFDPGFMRPYMNEHGDVVVCVNQGTRYNPDTDQDEPVYGEMEAAQAIANGVNVPVGNATTTLRKDDWLRVDRAVKDVQRQRLRVFTDLAAASSESVNGMGISIAEHETVSDSGFANVSMDGLAEGFGDNPIFGLEGTPLPITHSGFHIPERKLAISRNQGTPLSTIQARHASRKVNESVEKTTLGVQTGLTFGVAADYNRRAPTVWGYTNFPDRVTKTDMTVPTGSNGTAVLTDFLALRDLLFDKNFEGPFGVYTSKGWDQYLDNLFSTSEPSAGTLRSRLLQIDEISFIRRSSYLTTDYTVIFVSLTPETAKAIIGLPLTTVQWPTKGGMQNNFMVMTISVPQLFSDHDGRSGIGHGTDS